MVCVYLPPLHFGCLSGRQKPMIQDTTEQWALYTTLHNSTKLYTTLYNSTQLYKTLHNSTQLYTTLHNSNNSTHLNNSLHQYIFSRYNGITYLFCFILRLLVQSEPFSSDSSHIYIVVVTELFTSQKMSH